MAGPIGPVDPDVPRDYQQPLSPQYQRPLEDYDPRIGPTPTQTFDNSRNSSLSPKQRPQPLRPPTYEDDYYQPSSPPYDYDKVYEASMQPQNNDYNNDLNDYIVRVSLQNKRNKKRSIIQHVELTKGNLVLNCPVPDKVLKNVNYTEGEEFTHMRYTAATCDPNDFISNNYLLRPHIYGRKTELMVVITMYNENVDLFIKSVNAIIKNVAYLCNKEKSKVWGKDSWQKIVVVVVADGRSKVNKRVLEVLGAMGVYQEEVMQDSVVGEPVTCHLFEHTTQLMVEDNFDISGAEKNIPPIQMLFCLKEKNAKKLNSHRWFFNAFAAQLNPNVCILLDVGTTPYQKSIYHLWRAFDRDPNVGGACGEVIAELGPKYTNLKNPFVAAQNFEYKMANILDKPLESVFGYISVLPGAFSAYRYKALLDTAPGKGPLASYFKGETMHGGNAGILEANMYLAEDRILSFELVSKRHESWKLKYVKSAKAETDVPVTVPEFMSQRRRWLNGSFFAAIYSFVNFLRLWTSGQPFFRKILLTIIFIYNAIQLVYSWFSMGNFYLTFFFFTSSLLSTQLNEIVKVIYALSLIIIFVCSLGNRPQGSKWLYTLCIILFSIIMTGLLCSGGYTIIMALKDVKLEELGTKFQNVEFLNLVLSLASTYGLYIFASLIHGEPWHLITSIFQSLLLVPFYINVLMVYAFCNTHDISWGTKGDNGSAGGGNDVQPIAGKQNIVEVQVAERRDINDTYDDIIKRLKIEVQEPKQSRDAVTKKTDYYKQFRTNLVLTWVFSNVLLAFIFTSEMWNDYIKNVYGPNAYNPYLTSLFWAVNVMSAFRALGCVWYLVLRIIFG